MTFAGLVGSEGEMGFDNGEGAMTRLAVSGVLLEGEVVELAVGPRRELESCLDCVIVSHNPATICAVCTYR